MFKKFPRIRWITFLITLVSPQIAFSFYLLIYNLSLYKFLNNLPQNSLESNLAVITIFFIFPFSFYCFTTLIYSKKVITDKKNAEFDSCIFSLLWIVELILLGIIFLFLLDGVFAEYINNEAEVFLFDYIMMYYLFGIAIVILLILKSIIHFVSYKILYSRESKDNGES